MRGASARHLGVWGHASPGKFRISRPHDIVSDANIKCLYLTSKDCYYDRDDRGLVEAASKGDEKTRRALYAAQ